MMTTQWFGTDADVIAIGEGLTARTLPKARWTHAAHFAAAFWLVRERRDIEPTQSMPPLIRAYNEATGVPNTDTSGYHATITLASWQAVGAFLRKYPDLRTPEAVGAQVTHEVVCAKVKFIHGATSARHGPHGAAVAAQPAFGHCLRRECGGWHECC